MRQTLRYSFAFVALFMMFCITTACSDDDPIFSEIETPTLPDSGENNSGGDNNDDNNEDNTMNRNITITVGGKSFAATLADNETARAFAAMMPMTMQMDELNGNEKYHYLDSSLPADSYRPGTIRTGDIMLYGSSCVVLFYETFASSYSYTRIGQIDNPDGLATAVGNGNVSVKFEMQ